MKILKGLEIYGLTFLTQPSADGNAEVELRFRTAAGVGANYIIFERNGALTMATTSAIGGNRDLGSILFRGHDGTSYGNSANIAAKTIETFSGTARGTNLVFGTTAATTTVHSTKFVMGGDGNFTIGGTHLTGTGNLYVNAINSGTIIATTGTSRQLTLVRTAARQIGIETSSNEWGFYDDTNTKYALLFNGGAANNATFVGDVTIGSASAGKNIALYSSGYGTNGLARFFSPSGIEGMQLGLVSATASYIWTPASTLLYIYTGGSVRFIFSADGRFTLGSSEGTGTGAFYSAAITSSGLIKTTSASGFEVNTGTGMVPSILREGNSDSSPFLEQLNTATNYGWGFFNRSTEGDLTIQRRIGGSYIEAFRLARASGDATFAGNIVKATDSVTAIIQIKRTDNSQIGYFKTDGWGRFIIDNSLAIGHDEVSSGIHTTRLSVNGIVGAGANLATNGTLAFAPRYADGFLATYGAQHSSGGALIGYGIKMENGASYLSSTGIALQRSAFIVSNGLSFRTAGSSTTTIGTAITLSEVFSVDISGNTVFAGTVASKVATITDTATSILVTNTTGSPAFSAIEMKIAGTTKAYIGVIGTANSLINGTAAGDVAIRANTASKKIVMGDGSSIAANGQEILRFSWDTNVSDQAPSQRFYVGEIATAADSTYVTALRIPVVSYDVLLITARIVMGDVGGNGNAAAYTIIGTFRYDGGATIYQVGTTTVVSSHEDQAACDARFLISGTSYIYIQARGDATNIYDVKATANVILAYVGAPV